MGDEFMVSTKNEMDSFRKELNLNVESAISKMELLRLDCSNSLCECQTQIDALRDEAFLCPHDHQALQIVTSSGVTEVTCPQRPGSEPLSLLSLRSLKSHVRKVGACS